MSRFAYSNQQLINRWTCLNERLNVCSPYHHHQSTRRRLCNNNNEATNNVLTTTTTTFFVFFVFLLEIVSHTVRPSVRPSVVVLLIVQRWTVDELRFIISEAVQLLFIVFIALPPERTKWTDRWTYTSLWRGKITTKRKERNKKEFERTTTEGKRVMLTNVLVFLFSYSSYSSLRPKGVSYAAVALHTVGRSVQKKKEINDVNDPGPFFLNKNTMRCQCLHSNENIFELDSNNRN